MVGKVAGDAVATELVKATGSGLQHKKGSALALAFGARMKALREAKKGKHVEHESDSSEEEVEMKPKRKSRFVKGSAEAKAHMQKIRGARGKGLY